MVYAPLSMMKVFSGRDRASVVEDLAGGRGFVVPISNIVLGCDID